jgi:MarR family transcriptional regulator, organic hydroperoxide resistance regulator
LGAELNPHAERFRNAMKNLMQRLTQDQKNQSDIGLTRPQFFILHMLKVKGTCKVTALAEHMEVKPSAVTVMIDRLVNQGYVVRQHDPGDRRVVLMNLTEDGERVLQEFDRHSNEVFAKYAGRVEPEELEQMIRTLEKISGGGMPACEFGRNGNGNEGTN